MSKPKSKTLVGVLAWSGIKKDLAGPEPDCLGDPERMKPDSLKCLLCMHEYTCTCRITSALEAARS